MSKVGMPEVGMLEVVRTCFLLLLLCSLLTKICQSVQFEHVAVKMLQKTMPVQKPVWNSEFIQYVFDCDCVAHVTIYFVLAYFISYHI